MILRAALFAAALSILPPLAPAMAQSSSAAAVAHAMTDDELLRATALDEVFTQFGPGIAQSPLEQGVPFSSALNAAWAAAAHEVFDAHAMHRSLASALQGKFTATDYRAYADFFASDFGRKITEIERAVTTMPAAQQMQAREAGIALAADATGSRRADQIEEILELVSADISTTMVRQSVRGMLIGMSMSSQQGDIVVPWEDIDAQLDIIMPGIEADVALTQRAMMFFAYRPVSDEELDTYLEFLRTEPARKLYAVAAYGIGEIIAERMERFGETLVRKLKQVNI